MGADYLDILEADRITKLLSRAPQAMLAAFSPQDLVPLLTYEAAPVRQRAQIEILARLGTPGPAPQAGPEMSPSGRARHS